MELRGQMENQSAVVYFFSTIWKKHPFSAVLQQQIKQVPCITEVASFFAHGACDKGWENCWDYNMYSTWILWLFLVPYAEQAFVCLLRVEFNF